MESSRHQVPIQIGESLSLTVMSATWSLYWRLFKVKGGESAFYTVVLLSFPSHDHSYLTLLFLPSPATSAADVCLINNRARPLSVHSSGSGRYALERIRLRSRQSTKGNAAVEGISKYPPHLRIDRVDEVNPYVSGGAVCQCHLISSSECAARAGVYWYRMRSIRRGSGDIDRAMSQSQATGRHALHSHYTELVLLLPPLLAIPTYCT
ncbi:hypothetical protein J6590_030429 [Homalodisca vitripennis]|nr:hypothetical protein J6590_030429 [Homalodisca vitripennis]